MFHILRSANKNCISLSVFLSFFLIQSAFAASDSVIIGQQVTGICNNNGVCEAALGEDSAGCLADCPLPAVVPPSGGGVIFDTTAPIIQNLSIESITAVSAKVLWKTNELAVCQFFLGATEEYEKESRSEDSFFSDHTAFLNDLVPDSDYYFKIACSDTNKNKSEIKSRFNTLSLPDTVPPANVSDFKAASSDGKINLSWRNPGDADFQSVKLYRSESFFPKNPDDGKLIYEGRKTSFSDSPLENDKKYYYAIFAYDFSGNFSSGAVAAGKPVKFFPPSIPPGPAPPIIPPIPPVIPISPEVEKIKLEDFNFIQEGKKILPKGGEVDAYPEKSLVISINFQKIPKEIETMMLILEKDDGNEEATLFLFNANREKNEYSVAIVPPENNKYKMTIALLNSKNDVAGAVRGRLNIFSAAKIPEKISWYFYLLLILFIALILLILRYILKKASKLTSFEAKYGKNAKKSGWKE